MRISDWSSDVCSSDLLRIQRIGGEIQPCAVRLRADFALAVNRNDARWRGIAGMCGGAQQQSGGEPPGKFLHVDLVSGLYGRSSIIRSEERRVGKECVCKCTSRLSPYP